MEICADKYRPLLRLADSGLRSTYNSINTNKMLKRQFEKLDTDYPVILKTLRGSKGVGVFL